MAKAYLSVFRLRQPLIRPYRLSFVTLQAFDTLILVLRAEGRFGVGEITPLPGYSHETIDSALSALKRVQMLARKGVPIQDVIASVNTSDPMVASALACAVETQVEGVEEAFKRKIPTELPLAALCGGDQPSTAADRARELQESGYTHLKLKVGSGSIKDDINRLRAVAVVLGAGVLVSVDANQRLSKTDAHELCAAAEELPVLLVEQPFRQEAWDAHAALAASTPVPLMLDESIWTSADIDRAADIGAAWVKLKLCKHPGMAANLALIDRARSRGLGVIYGNGVQGAVGNHLEARLYAAAELNTPGEFNGILKLADDPFGGQFIASEGYLNAGGLRRIDVALDQSETVAEAVFTA